MGGALQKRDAHKRKAAEIKDVVSSVIQAISEKRGEGQKDVGKIWKKHVGEKMAKHTKAEGIRKEALYITADCSVWMYQCRLKYRDLLGKMKRDFPGIKRLIFKIGKVL